MIGEAYWQEFISLKGLCINFIKFMRLKLVFNVIMTKYLSIYKLNAVMEGIELFTLMNFCGTILCFSGVALYIKLSMTS